ncbi:hypothetical protein [Streptacidiphilus sp. P02-A3a]|uniref:hypothetical protein n=1 Tax=Streptacidiphilus sp. P02-A3a TaxID=2704468 RepID=UPI0015FB415B|nr:hypothetical protein [Streptacidiphilus sp. P02-A3a]QMU69822.1 hypothetical protein GXP74_17800 [Streptacidiphilus sp. P02-A3a]
MINTTHTRLPATRTRGRQPAVSPGALALRTLTACAVAIASGFVLTYLVRAMLNLDAFQNAGQIEGGGFPNSGALTVGIITATLIAVAVLVLLERAVPRPLPVFAAVMALGYIAFFAVTVTSTGSLTRSQMAGQLLVCLPLAAVIGVLASWATDTLPDMP